MGSTLIASVLWWLRQVPVFAIDDDITSKLLFYQAKHILMSFLHQRISFNCLITGLLACQLMYNVDQIEFFYKIPRS